MTTEELERELRAMRSEPDPDFARRLDEWAAADFPANAGLGPRVGAQGRAGGSLRRVWERIAAVPPRRVLMPVGAVATVAVVAAVAISQGGPESQNLTVSEPAGRQADQAAPEGFAAGSDDDGAAGAESAAPPADQLNSVPATGPTSDSDGIARGDETRIVDATARLSLGTEASKVQDVSNQVVDVTDRYDGIVLDSRVTTDQGGARANFSLEIPYKQLDAALADLSGLADVISRTEGGEDITAKAVRAQRDLANTLEQVRKARIALIEADTREEKLVIQSQIDSLNATADAYRTELNGVQRQGALCDRRRGDQLRPLRLGLGRRLEHRRRLPRRRARPRGDRRHRPGHPRGDAAGVADRAARLGDRLTDGQAPPRSRPQLRNPAGCSASRPLPPGLGGTGAALLVRLEVGLAGAADGAEPGVGDLAEVGPGRDAAVGIALVGVVDEPAGAADPQLLRLGLGAHGSAGYRPAS